LFDHHRADGQVINIIHRADGLIIVFAPTGDNQSQSRRRATIHHHRADGRPLIIVAPTGADGQYPIAFAPTGDNQSQSRRRATIQHHRADGRPLIIVAPTGAIYFMRCADVRP
jgi:hypothetical protein